MVCIQAQGPIYVGWGGEVVMVRVGQNRIEIHFLAARTHARQKVHPPFALIDNFLIGQTDRSSTIPRLVKKMCHWSDSGGIDPGKNFLIGETDQQRFLIGQTDRRKFLIGQMGHHWLI